MPFAFPSHPGLIAPLWRRWPAHFNALGCASGAMVPDAVDGLIGFARGHLGQSLGHSLVGLFGLCLPAGLVGTWALLALARRVARGPGGRAVRLAAALVRAGAAPPGAGGSRAAVVLACSVWLGALSHLAFDFVSHGNFLWLLPWYEPASFFPAWWHTRWLEVPLPGYRAPYPIGPHFLVWSLLSVAGAVLWFWPSGDRSRGSLQDATTRPGAAPPGAVAAHADDVERAAGRQVGGSVRS